MKFIFQTLLRKTGIRIDGPNPWDPQIRNSAFYTEVLKHGSLGLGESYMQGWWECARVDEFICRLLKARLDRFSWFNPVAVARYLKARAVNNATPDRAFDVADLHYDLGNDLFQAMLDPRMTYTCAYWSQGAATLAQAQEAKLDLVCRKLNLKAGQKILDIGCGWGSWAHFAAERYGVSVVGITVAKEQLELARQMSAGLPIEYRLQDYREVNEQFDHIISLGMFEHVEPKNYATYFKVVKRCLKSGGLFLLHTIGVEKGKNQFEPWLRKYIFPVGTFPSKPEMHTGARDILKILDWHDLGPSNYDRTLMAWHENFTKYWPELSQNYAGKVNGQFKRMWDYYLLCCAGGFRAERQTVYHVVFSDASQAYLPVR